MSAAAVVSGRIETTDQHLRHQQNLAAVRIAIAHCRTKSELKRRHHAIPDHLRHHSRAQPPGRDSSLPGRSRGTNSRRVELRGDLQHLRPGCAEPPCSRVRQFVRGPSRHRCETASDGARLRTAFPSVRRAAHATSRWIVHERANTGHLMDAVGELRRGEFVSVSTTWRNVNASVRARFSVCIYNIAVPTQRLTLLSCLAGTRGGAQDYELLSETRSPLHWHVAHLQLALNLHMTEVDLSRRLGADPLTERHWFMKSGLLGPKRFMLRMQLSEVVCVAVKLGCTIDNASRTLGFSQPETVRRNSRNVVELSAADIRAGRGRETTRRLSTRSGSPERS